MTSSILARGALVLACGVLALSSCKSKDSAPPVEVETVEVVCTCGDPMTDFEGCAHPDCISGKGNSDNPHCVCGTIDLDQ